MAGHLKLRELLNTLVPGRQTHASLARLEESLAAQKREIRRLRVQVQTLARQHEQRHRKEKDLRDLIYTLEHQRKLQSKWETGASWQLNAIVRRLFLPGDIPMPFRLAARRFKLRSQHEEDGYLLALLEEIGTTDRRFVEIGSGRSGGNAGVLAFEMGWSGLMVDANPEAIEYIDKTMAFNETVTGLCTTVTPENVNTMLEAHGFRGDLDLLSIDIDSYDYWILDALEAGRPRVLMLEYNAGFGPERSVTIPKDAMLESTPKGYFGASLAALTKLAARKGYRLIACEYSGANAFFLRNDVAPSIEAQPVARAYRPQMSRLELEVESKAPQEILRRIAELNLPLQEV